ncbi:hypothetical protein FWF89_03700 [Candidatus Saccharibacteria bacterium]|nr:hypothetical protein [Candidatus Saccharibacteria bacterium]
MDGNANAGGAGTPIAPAAGAATMPQPMMPVDAMAIPEPKRGKGSIIEIIILILVSLIAVAAAGFAVYFYLQWDESRTNVEGQIAEAVAIARADERQIAEEIFAEREKEPNRRFTGPADYGSLSFMFPRTWSVYIARDASIGGDFEAYLHPGEVSEVGQSTINALRVSIINQPIDTVRMMYDAMATTGQLKQSVFQNATITGDRFEGEFNQDITGIMIMFKINDKTAILRTDAMIFRNDFDKLIQTITLN